LTLVALFGRVENAYIHDVNIVNAYVMGRGYVATLAGEVVGSSIIANIASHGTVEALEWWAGGMVGIFGNATGCADGAVMIGCRATVSVLAGGERNGGLVGESYRSITDSSAAGTVTGYMNVGGLVGLSISGDVTDSHATGNVRSHASHAGGLIGNMRTNYQWINRCYATGNVSADHHAGGFIGYCWEEEYVFVDNCFATGAVQASRYAGGFIGTSYNTRITKSYSVGVVTASQNIGGFVSVCGLATIADCYWDVEASRLSESDCGSGKTTAQVKQQATFVNWDFANIWTITEGESYPELLSLMHIAPSKST
jgi:hypothetical protein